MLYQTLQNTTHKKLAILIDPDKQPPQSLLPLIHQAIACKVDLILVGGSLLMNSQFEQTILTLKKNSTIPVVIFPGTNYQISPNADALLLLSLLSGRNAEYLIGQHVAAAPFLKESGIEIISTGYILIDGGINSSTAYITQTLPIPNHKPDIAVATAIAGQMLGMKLIYLEAGSGATHTVSSEIVNAVKKNITVPLLVGGGIQTGTQARQLCQAGADIIVIGNSLEKDPTLLLEIAQAVHGSNS